MLKSTEFTDVTLVCNDDQEILAHKVVLTASSPVFKRMLRSKNHPNPIIYLKDVNFQEMDSILQFIYLGQTTFNQNRISEFLNVAKSLEIKELSKNLEIPIAQQQPKHTKRNSYVKDKVKTENTHGLEAPAIVCNNCDYTALDELDLMRHVKRSHKTEYKCDNCAYVTNDTDDLKEHIKNIHNRILVFQCRKCNFKAQDKEELKKHVAVTHDPSIPQKVQRIKCAKCEFTTTMKSEIAKHMNSQHPNKQYACFICPYKAMDKAVLKSHILSEHNNSLMMGPGAVAKKTIDRSFAKEENPDDPPETMSELSGQMMA